MGTTSEELKKLYAKLGGKDPKVAGFSAPGEILNAINEIPLPTEYELPTVTTEDAGDVLVVNEEGKWDKGEAGSGVVPNPEGEATVDLTKLGIDDTVYGIPKDTVVVEIDDNYNFKDPSMTVGTLHNLCKTKNVVIHYASSVNDNVQYFLPYGTVYLWRDSAIYLVFSRYMYSDKFYENPTTHDQYFLYGNITTGGLQKKLLYVQHTNPLLPKPSTGDSGKILLVDSNNKWSIDNPPASLPEVTAADNGDILQVVNGAWTKAAASGGDVVVYKGQFVAETVQLVDATIADIADDIYKKKAVFLHCYDGNTVEKNGVYYYSGSAKYDAGSNISTIHFSKDFYYYNGTEQVLSHSELYAYRLSAGNILSYGKVDIPLT